jgi:hypothetical protein
MENQTVIPEQGTLLILAATQIMANNEPLKTCITDELMGAFRMSMLLWH